MVWAVAKVVSLAEADSLEAMEVLEVVDNLVVVHKSFWWNNLQRIIARLIVWMIHRDFIELRFIFVDKFISILVFVSFL